jgi:acetolactate synthase-1/2/3 large subunit
VRVTDYIAQFVYDLGVKEVFWGSGGGGGMMFLSDGIASHPHLKVVCCHHEQAAAMAAVAYAKTNENIGVCYVTTGCGGTNAITGLLGAWQDNIPCLFISGQSKRKESIYHSAQLDLRQFGVQEVNIIPIVEPLTKHALFVANPNFIAYYLEEAVYIAKSGRPGPVWLDVPLDVQAAEIDPAKMAHYKPQPYDVEPSDVAMHYLVTELARAKRPVVIAGHGVRLAKAIPEFERFVFQYQLPTVATMLGADILAYDNPLFVGHIGNKGDRAGNFAVQNADLVISIGARLSVSSTGHEYKNFAPQAKLVVVDIDPIEHEKGTVKIDRFIHADAKLFLAQMNERFAIPMWGEWVDRCHRWKDKYPVCLPEYANDENGLNQYYFTECLSDVLGKDAVVVYDAGSAFYVVRQGMRVKRGQRLICTGAQGEMGFAIPAAIGACIANGNKQVVCVTGDGSLQVNIQELQTIVHHKLPIIIFVWNNGGYLSIRSTQRRFFEERFIGTDDTCGVSFPDLQKIAYAYGIEFWRVDESDFLREDLIDILDAEGPVICEVMCDPTQEVVPTVASARQPDGSMVSRPLEDMYPFLDRWEFAAEMGVDYGNSNQGTT